MREREKAAPSPSTQPTASSYCTQTTGDDEFTKSSIICNGQYSELEVSAKEICSWIKFMVINIGGEN